MMRTFEKAILGSAAALVILTGASTAQPVPPGGSQDAPSEVCTGTGRIAFVRDFPRTGRNHIYTIRPNGEGLKKVTDGRSGWSPAWSPDGSYLLYDGKREGDTRVQIYRIDADGSNPVKMTTHEWGGATPAWSSDGEWIAFASVTSADDFDMELFKMRSDGSELTQLTDNDVQDWTPSWSPDGSQIAYGSNDKVKVMNSDGTGVKKISGKLLASNPDWRPQGNLIVFHSDHYHSGGAEIWTMRPDGSDRKRLTRRPGPDQSPVWSPDGKRIAYSKNWNLAVMRRDGSRSRIIHKGTGDVYAPDWQPRCTTS